MTSTTRPKKRQAARRIGQRAWLCMVEGTTLFHPTSGLTVAPLARSAACYVELRLADGPTVFGAGIDSNIVTASFKAVLSAVNRELARACVA